MVILTEPTAVPVPCRKIIHDLKVGTSPSAEYVVYACKQIEEEKVYVAIPGQDLLNKVFSKHKFNGAVKSLHIVYGTQVHLGALGFGDKVDEEVCYVTGQALAAKMYSEDPASVSVIFDNAFSPTLTNTMLISFLHRFMYGFVKNQEYKGVKGKRDEPRKLTTLNIVTGQSNEQLETCFETARKLAMASLFNAAMVDAPPNYLNCKTYVEAVEAEVKGREGLTMKVLNENDCAAEKMGAFLAVAQGSRHGARLIHLTYTNGAANKKVAFVGKGITMDTGGYSLKPAGSMLWMKCDMGGSAAVLSAAIACADLQVKDVEVHFIAMVCENMVDKDAYRPGDIVTASNGKTIEIQNTDAEGRLALADGLVYAEKILGGPGKGIVVDIATLTGACLVALGTELTAVYSNCDKTKESFLSASARAGEAAWPMPLRKSYSERMSGKISDLKNAHQGYSYGGSITAALFLQNFVSPKTSWIHLDIAGSGWNFTDNAATGWGVASLIQFIQQES